MTGLWVGIVDRQFRVMHQSHGERVVQQFGHAVPIACIGACIGGRGRVTRCVRRS